MIGAWVRSTLTRHVRSGMIWRLACAVWIAVCTVRPAAAQQRVPASNRADEPAHVTELPPELRTALARAGCGVPRFPPAVRGDTSAVIPFVAYRATVMKASRADWVVLCQHGRAREAVVYRTPVAPAAKPVARLPLTDWTPEDEGCEGWIGIADSSFVREVPRVRRALAREHRVLVHQAIIDGICEDSKRMYYWTGRQWLHADLP